MPPSNGREERERELKSSLDILVLRRDLRINHSSMVRNTGISQMTFSPPDVQNVPDIWTLLEKARSAAVELCVGAMPTSPDWHKWFEVRQEIDAALAQRDRFVLVPKDPYVQIRQYADMLRYHRDDLDDAITFALAASPKLEETP